MSSMKYVVAPSDDSTPPTLTIAIWQDTAQGIGGGVDGLGMVIPEGREKLGIETLGTAGNDVAAGRMRVTAALAPWNAGGRRWVALKKRACT
jgi:hypothetical protein